MGGEPTFAGAIVNGEVAPEPAFRCIPMEAVRSGRAVCIEIKILAP
jgi:hypothetical protein